MLWILRHHRRALAEGGSDAFGRARADVAHGEDARPARLQRTLNGFEGMGSVEDGSREVVRAALADPDDKGGAFTRRPAMPIPW